MKKIFVLSFMSLTFSSFAANTGTLLVKGTIPVKLNISVTPETVASALDLSTTQTNTKVATVNERSNSHSGYKVTIASQNLGVLKNNSHTFPYSLSYGGTILNLVSAVTQSQGPSQAVNVNKNVQISYSGVPAEQLVAGDYSDIITFTIAAN